MHTLVERLFEIHECENKCEFGILEGGYRTIPPDFFVDPADLDGHVISWSECFAGIPQNPVIFLEDSGEFLASHCSERQYRRFPVCGEQRRPW